MICRKINWYHFLVHLMCDQSEVKLSDDVVFYSVVLNKCQMICIYILSYLYTVTLYSEWLLQIGNIIFCLSFLLDIFLLLSYSHVTLGDYP